MPRIGPTELIIVLVIVLIIFGAGKLPQIGGALGKGIREFRKASKGGDEDEKVAQSESKTLNEASHSKSELPSGEKSNGREH